MSEPVEHRLEAEVANNPVAQRDFMDRLSAFGRSNHWPRQVASEIELALEEWLTNVISYGFPDPAEHVIHVSLTSRAHEVEIVVVDDGKAFDLLQHPPPDIRTAIEHKPVGGVGILMVRKLMTDVQYERRQGKNRVRFRKRFDSPSLPANR